jgi:hypothetical protein
MATHVASSRRWRQRLEEVDWPMEDHDAAEAISVTPSLLVLATLDQHLPGSLLSSLATYGQHSTVLATGH